MHIETHTMAPAFCKKKEQYCRSTRREVHSNLPPQWPAEKEFKGLG
jgi:hypothetical protein